MITIAYYTLGCKVNQYETEKIRESLEKTGFATVPFGSCADAYVINTCTVTGVADSKSRAAVRRAVRANPNAFVIVAGCYAELEPERIGAIEGVDLVVSNEEKEAIPERIIAHFEAVPPHPNPLPPGERESSGLRTGTEHFERLPPSPQPSPAGGEGVLWRSFNIQHSTFNQLHPQLSTLNSQRPPSASDAGCG